MKIYIESNSRWEFKRKALSIIGSILIMTSSDALFHEYRTRISWVTATKLSSIASKLTLIWWKNFEDFNIVQLTFQRCIQSVRLPRSFAEVLCLPQRDFDVATILIGFNDGIFCTKLENLGELLWTNRHRQLLGNGGRFVHFDGISLSWLAH